MVGIDILSDTFELRGKVVAKKKWKCDFCGHIINPYDEYYWVARKGNQTATLRACKKCGEKKIISSYEKLLKG